MSTLRHNNHPAKEEAPGTVTSDSLAAESVRRGGKFAENIQSKPAEVKADNSTLGKNPSSASKLDAAPDAEARMVKEQWGEERRQTRSQTKAREQQGGQGSGGQEGQDKSGSKAKSGSSVPPAPHYVDSVIGAMQDTKPKGKNLTEGGFEDDPSKNVSFNADIGSKNDPALRAENIIESRNARNSGTGSAGGDRVPGPTPGSERKTNASFDILGSEQDV